MSGEASDLEGQRPQNTLSLMVYSVFEIPSDGGVSTCIALNEAEAMVAVHLGQRLRRHWLHGEEKTSAIRFCIILPDREQKPAEEYGVREAEANITS